MTEETTNSIPDFLESLRDESERVSRAFEQAKKAIVFGTGSSALPVRDHLAHRGIVTIGFCDNDPTRQSTTLDGLPILAPSELAEQPDVLVAIASDWAQDIALQLRSLEVNSLVDLTYPRYAAHNDLSLMVDHASELQLLYDALHDDDSRETLLGLLAYRATMDPTHLKVASYEQYACPTCLARHGDVIVDAGAWEGDTALVFARECGGDCRVYAFEPFPETYEKMVQALAGDPLGQSVTPVNAGLSDEDGIARMVEDSLSPSGNMLSDEGSEVVSLSRLDTFLAGIDARVTVIKMDIEGAEAAALRGAESAVRLACPRLMISVYHKPADLWELPAMILDMNAEYRLSLGHHKPSSSETVVYATQRSSAETDVQEADE